MMRKVNVFVVLVTAVLILAAASPAFAVAGLPETTADGVATELVDLVKDILPPLGAVCIFVAIAWTALKLVITAHKPQERAEAMSAIPYILGGGIGLGAVLILTGVVVGLMIRVGGA